MTQILCCLILHSPCSFWFVRFIFLCGGREGMQMVMHFPCLPSFLFLVHVGVSLLYGLAFHWIVYAFVFVSVFCMESIMWVRKRDGLNILLDKKGSAVGQQFSRLKNSFSEDSKHVKSNSGLINSSSTSCLDVSSLVTTPFNDSPASSSSSFIKSPWISSLEGSADLSSPAATAEETNSSDELICSLVRKEGHVYSMAVSGDLLYTGSDSKNIRVWNKHKEFSGFKSNGGLVKAIVIAGQKIFTGHRDGKIRVWKSWTKNSTGYHKRVGTLPTFKDNLKNIIKPISYFDVRECRRGFSLRHMDAISCLCFNEDKTLLYSASWDKTFKVWRVSDWRCLETIRAHEDTVNSIVAGCDGLVFTGSADGTVKVWRRGMEDKGTKHLLFQTLLQQDSAITALAVNHDATFVYCGSSDGLVNFWEYDGNLTHRGALRGHKLAVLCLATAGNLVITGSGDKSISVWKRCGSQHFLLTTLTGHSGPIKCLAIEKDQEESTTSYGENQWRLYSGSLDKSVKIWQLSEGTPQSQSPNKTISSYVKRASSSLSIRLALESGN